MFITLASAADVNMTTNASGNTETDAYSLGLFGGSVQARIMSFQMQGKGAALTTISGIVVRHVRFTTESTGGTGVALRALDPGLGGYSPISSLQYRPTAGSGRTNLHISGCGAAGPGGFVAEYPQCMPTLAAGSTSSLDGLDASGTTSLTYEWSLKMGEGIPG